MAVLGAAAGGRICLARHTHSQVRINSSVDMDKLGSDLEKTQAAFSFEGQASPAGPLPSCPQPGLRGARRALAVPRDTGHILPGLARTGGVFGPHPAGTYSVYAVRRLGRKSSSRFACA